MNENHVGAIIATGVFLVILAFIGWGFYCHEVTPRRMAEKNLCWEYLPNSTQDGSYQLCKAAK